MAVVSCLTGGFGNQLFQYAMGYAVAKDNDDRYLIDVSQFKYDKRKCEIQNLNITADILNVEAAKSDNKISRLIARINRLKQTGLFSTIFFQENAKEIWSYAYPNITYKKNIYLNGYWQNWRYFNKYRENLLKEFAPKSGVIRNTACQLINEVSKNQSVAVHIRRGDYVECDGWLINEQFYLDALKIMDNIYKDYSIYVFCEDSDFVSKLLNRKQYVLVTNQYGLTDIEEFYVMSACRNHIISNSSFSWWAAYLSDYNGHKVVAPVFKQWTKQFYLPDWSTIDMAYYREGMILGSFEK